MECHLINSADQPTGTALILVGDDTGDNMITVIPGANGTLTAQSMDSVAISKKDTVLLQLEVPLPAIGSALMRAKEANVPSILNIAPWQKDGAAPSVVSVIF